MTEQEPIDIRPAWLVNVQAEGTQPGSLTVDGNQYRYTVVKKGLAPGLPYAVGFPDETALFISEDVPVEDRAFIMGHEVREKTRFVSLPEEQRCQAALQAELSDVQTQSPDRYPTYVTQRTALFDALVKFYEQPQQQAAVTPQFRQAIQASRNHLQQMRSATPGNGPQRK